MPNNSPMTVSSTDILERLGLSALSPMQEEMGRQGMGRQDIILLSPTGSGKTLAYLLPLLSKTDADKDTLQAIVIVPSRELALQNEATLRAMKTPLRSLSLFGGRPAMEEHRRLRETNPQIVFATPGRLNDHLAKENLSPAAVRIIVIDEFDKCLESGFEEEMFTILRQMPPRTQRWLLSATDSIEIPRFIETANATRIDYSSRGDAPSDRITLYAVTAPRRDKLETLGHLLTRLGTGQSIVFCAHRESAERIGRYLKSEGFIAEIYHGGLEQDLRERSLFRFRYGAATVLVATDLAARGLDIPEVESVIHYHLPLDEATFTHRQGRTARWDSRGHAFLLLGPEESLPEFAAAASPYDAEEDRPILAAKPQLTALYIGRGKKEKLSKGDIVGLLCKKGGLRGEEIGAIDVRDHHAYVAVPRACLKATLRAIAGEKIKGMRTIIEEMK